MHSDPLLTLNDQVGDENSGRAKRAKLFALLRGRWHWAIILALLLAVAGAYAGYMSEKHLYQATSYINIKENVVYGGDIEWRLTEQYNTYVATQMKKMQEDVVIHVAMEDPEWRESQTLRPPELGEYTSSAMFSRAIQITPPSRRDPMIYVSFVDADPKTAQAGLNALMAAYKRVHSDEATVYSSETLRTLQNLRQSQTRKREELLNDRANVMREEDIPTLNNSLEAKLSALAIRERELESLNLRMKNWIDMDGNPTPAMLDELSQADPQMEFLQAELGALEDQLEHEIEVRQRGDNHPMVQSLRRAIGIAERKILDLENSYLQGDVVVVMPPEIQAQLVERDGLIEAITKLNANIDDLSRKKQAIDEINIELLEIRERIAQTNRLIDDHEATQMAVSQSDRAQVELGPAASTPSKPYNLMKRRQMAAAGGLAGIVMGFGMVMLVGLMDRRLRHVTDATAGMPDANVLGILPTLPNNLSDPAEAEAAAHCVHHIRTLLQIGGNGRVFSVTSPTAGSGKSSLTSALGLSFATSQTKTLVIDCDLVGAGLSRRMGTVVHQPLDVIIRNNALLDEDQLDRAMTIAASEGTALDMVLLRDGMMTESEIETAVRLQRDTSLGVLEACTPGRLRSCVAAADVPNLFILPVGNARPADAGKLSPVTIRSLIQQAREDFDIVLVDTGPVLGSLEASIAAAEADGTVLIVSRGDQKSLVQRSLTQLASVHANVAGIVFNHALDNDLAHTSYASIVSQDRRPSKEVRRKRLPDSGKVARYGPLGSAVASYSEEGGDNGSMNGHADN
ncbi:hypothetical protein OT109_14310 [Phycisphaeraceae bacterium D3-23]